MLTSLEGGIVFGERTGDGEPEVVALHGWGRSHRDFVSVLSGEVGVEKCEFTSLAVDLPGFGSSPPPPTAWSTSEYAELIARVIGENAVVVLGHSFGGRVAVKLAAMYPQRVRGMVLTGVPLFANPGVRTRASVTFRLAKLLHRAGLMSDDRIESARRRHGSTDYRNAHGVMRDVLVKSLQDSYREDLGALACPVTLVWGDDDTEAPLAVARTAAEIVSNSNLVVCRGAGHLTPRTVPGELRTAIEGMLT